MPGNSQRIELPRFDFQRVAAIGFSDEYQVGPRVRVIQCGPQFPHLLFILFPRINAKKARERRHPGAVEHEPAVPSSQIANTIAGSPRCSMRNPGARVWIKARSEIPAGSVRKL
jgi:hypothetical protein